MEKWKALLKSKKAVGIAAGVIVLFLGIFVELCLNGKVMSLPAGEKGITEIPVSSDAVRVERDLCLTDKGLVLYGEEGWVTITLNRYVDKFGYDFSAGGTMSAELIVTAENVYGDEVTEIISDDNSAMLTSSVISLRKNVKEIRIHVTSGSVMVLEEAEPKIEEVTSRGPFAISRFFVKNEASFHWTRALFIWVIVGLAVFYLVCADRIGQRIEIGFLVTVLSVGSLIVLLLPATKVGWDEEMHFFRSWQTSYFPASTKTDTVIEAYMTCGRMTWPLNLPDTREEREELHDFVNRHCDPYAGATNRGVAAAGQYTPAYLLPALMLRIGRLLHLPFTVIYQMGRFGNLFLYAAVMYFAIRMIPIGKRILTMIGLMPTTLFLACTYSYDATVIAFTALGLAITLKEILTPEEALSWKTFFLTGFVFLFGMISKAVYAPLVLTALALPAGKFKDKKQARLVRGGVVLAFLFLVATFVLPTLVAGQEVADFRGGDTSSVSQMSYILGNPVAYAKVLIANIWNTAPDYLAGMSVFGLMGHLGGVPFAHWFYILAAAVVFTDTYRDGRILKPENPAVLCAGRKVWMFLLCGASAALVWTGLYMAYTEVGKTVIAGVQGRYYLPLLLPLYLILNQPRLKNTFSEKAYNRFLLLTLDLVLFGAVLTMIVLPSCF
ncbi:MAG: DUF2142 domain-containing protein [Lachnospiraceae bacterium]|nr:DUF2142 domain-containing protein [Lachnospiraceae bacterium]